MLAWREKDVCEREKRRLREQNGVEWKTKQKWKEREVGQKKSTKRVLNS